MRANVFTDEEASIIFSNIHDIYTMHMEFMENISKDAIPFINTSVLGHCPPIAPLFIKMVAPWQQYTPYPIIFVRKRHFDILKLFAEAGTSYQDSKEI